MMYTLISIAVLAVLGYIIKSITKPPKYPPGPKWYPFVGCSGVVQSATKKHGSQSKGFSELAKEYSTQVLGLKLGRERVVVVYGEDNLKQVFTDAEFEGRPQSYFGKLRCLGKRMGITFTDGPLWKLHRQFTVKQLRNVGFGKTEMEQEIQREMEVILNYIEKNCSKPINTKSILSISVMNILWKFTAGETVDEERLKHLINLLNRRSRAFSMAGGWLNVLPWCRFIFPNLSGYNLIVKINKELSKIIDETILKHNNKEVEGKDFIYSFLEETNENKDKFTEEHLKIICLDMLIAGSQTTSNLLEFAILTLLRNTALQEKIYDEIKSVVGDALPSWTDNCRLPYTAAFIEELHRYYTIVPLAGPRRVLADAFINGYFIPKETTVLIATGHMNMDPEIWDEPHIFKPERFINEQGLFVNTNNVYKFGLGRRRCPGDSLAKSFIFIVLVGILQKFRIVCSNGVLPSNKPNIGLVSSPKPFTATFIPRS